MSGEPVGGVGEAHRREGVGNPLAPLAPRDVEEPREPGDVLAARERRLDRELLGDVADQPPHGHPRSRDVASEHRHRSLLHRQERVEHADRRRLSGAVRPEQPEHLAGLDAQVDPVDGDVLAEAVAKAPQLESRNVVHAARAASG